MCVTQSWYQLVLQKIWKNLEPKEGSKLICWLQLQLLLLYWKFKFTKTVSQKSLNIDYVNNVELGYKLMSICVTFCYLYLCLCLSIYENCLQNVSGALTSILFSILKKELLHGIDIPRSLVSSAACILAHECMNTLSHFYQAFWIIK